MRQYSAAAIDSTLAMLDEDVNKYTAINWPMLAN